MKRLEEMTMAEAREYCLKLERDRARSRRKSDQGAFEFSFGSLDAFTERFEDPDKIAAFSDGGKGAADIRNNQREAIIDEALSELSKSDAAFAKAVLAGNDWREMGYKNNSGFYKRLKKVEKFFLSKEAAPPKILAIRLEGTCGCDAERKADDPQPVTPARASASRTCFARGIASPSGHDL